MWVLLCWPAAGSPRSYQCVWRICMALHTCVWKVYWGWGRCDRLNQSFIFCRHTWYDMYDELYLVCLGECSRSRTKEGLKVRLLIPSTWCRVWFLERVCDTWCIIRKWLHSYERFFAPVCDTWYLVHHKNVWYGGIDVIVGKESVSFSSTTR